MNLLILNEKDRKALLKLVNEKDIKFLIKREKLEKQALFAFKDRLDKVNVKVIYEYVYENCLNSDDAIVSAYKKLLGGKIADIFKNAKRVAKIVSESEFEELTEEQNKELEKYKKGYEDSEMPISYEEFIKINCIPNKEDTTEQLIENALKSITKEKEKVEKELEKTKNQLFNLKTNFNKLNSDKKKIENDNKTLSKQIKSLEKKFSVENTITNIKKIIPEKFSSKTYEELLKELNELEGKYIADNKFDKAQEVLAAKYALIKSRKEDK